MALLDNSIKNLFDVNPGIYNSAITFDVDFYFFVINNPFVNNWNINESYAH